MDDRRGVYRDGLPEASDAFIQAIIEGGEDIRRYERRRRRAAKVALAAAAFALVALGLGAALRQLSAPRPDNVVLSVNPDSVVTDEEKAAARATAEPTETPVADEKTWIDPNSGWEYLLDDGPFEAGEWLVVTDADGCLAYGFQVDFRERPSGQARSIEVVPGMQVCYLGEADAGFSRVNFAGTDGYVETKYLRRGAAVPELDEAREWVISEACLYLVDSLGERHLWTVDDNNAVETYALQKLLEGAQPLAEGEGANAPLGALLLVRMQDADAPMRWENGAERFIELRYAMASDGNLVFRREDGSRWAIPAAGSRFFWSVFPEAEGWMRLPGDVVLETQK